MQKWQKMGTLSFGFTGWDKIGGYERLRQLPRNPFPILLRRHAHHFLEKSIEHRFGVEAAVEGKRKDGEALVAGVFGLLLEGFQTVGIDIRNLFIGFIMAAFYASNPIRRKITSNSPAAPTQIYSTGKRSAGTGNCAMR